MELETSLAVVILNWNNGPDSVACIQMVQAWNDPTVTVWVIDNASQDGSADLIAQQCPGVHLIRSDVNRGFGGGCNLGIAAALAAGSQMTLLLNNDASIDANNLNRLRETLRSDSRLGVVGPLVRDRERPEVLLSAGGRDISRHLISHLRQPPRGQTVYPVDYVPGTVALIRVDLLREVGLLDEAYFFGAEMADLCERARKQGFVSAIDVRAVAFHSVERSSDLRSRLHIYYVVRNRLLYIKKRNRRRSMRAVWLLTIWTLYSLGLLLRALVQRNRAQARAIGLALWHAFTGTSGGQNDLVLPGGVEG